MHAYVGQCMREASTDWLNAGARPGLVREVVRHSFLCQGSWWLRRPVIEEIAIVSAVEPGAAVLFTQLNTGRIGRITTKGEITEFSLPAERAFPSMITAGPEGALWFTLNQANAIGRVTVDGDVDLHPLPTPGAAPVGITSDGDAMWFAEIAAGQIGRISADGGIGEFPLPDRTAKPHAIVAASVGDCRFTEWRANRLGRVTSVPKPRTAWPRGTAPVRRRPRQGATERLNRQRKRDL